MADEIHKADADAARREAQRRINESHAERKWLEAEYGQVWDTEELQRDYEVQGFAAPYVVVVRKADGARGTLAFQHEPRFYFDFYKA